MKARALILFSLIVLLAFFARAEVEWSAKVDFEALFPSYIISTATIQQPKANTDVAYLRDKNGQVGCEVISPEDDCLFKVEISSSKFIKISILEGRLPKAGRKYRIYPSLEYDFDALYKVIEPVPETVSVRLELAGKSVGIKKKIVQVHSVQDCVFAVKKDDGAVRQLGYTFAAYVNENNPLIDGILKEALDLKLVEKFDGYQGGEGAVYEQAFAIWNVLQRRGIKYSNITTPSAESTRVFSQHVRSLEDCVQNTQANCVDGSVLFASVFRKIGFKTFLVLTPGHCFMGIVANETEKKVLIVETTLIGGVDLQRTSLERGMNSFLSGRKNNLSHTSFEQATSVGWEKYQEAVRENEAKTPGYQLINIDRCRQIGIQPLKSKPIQ